MKALKNYITHVINDPLIDDLIKSIKMYKMFLAALKKMDMVAEPAFTFGCPVDIKFVKIPPSKMLEYISYDEDTDSVDIKECKENYTSTYHNDVILFSQEIRLLKENILENTGKTFDEAFPDDDSPLKNFFYFTNSLSSYRGDERTVKDTIPVVEKTLERLRIRKQTRPSILPLSTALLSSPCDNSVPSSSNDDTLTERKPVSKRPRLS